MKDRRERAECLQTLVYPNLACSFTIFAPCNEFLSLASISHSP